MLYDPKWDVLSPESLILWLEKQDPTVVYNYADHKDCLICRMLHDCGYQNVWVGSTFVMFDDNWDNRVELSRKMDVIAGYKPHTYKAALERAKGMSGRL